MPETITEGAPPDASSLMAVAQKRRRFAMAWRFTAAIILIGASILVIRRMQRAYVQEISLAITPRPPAASEVGLPPTAMHGVGLAIPRVQLMAPDGSVAYLADFSGKPFVLAVFASWNAASLDAVRLLSVQYQTLAGQGIAAYAIANLETAAQVGFFAKRGSYAVPMLADEYGAMGEALKLTTLPAFFFIDAEGILRDRHTGLLTEEEFTAKASRLLTKF